MRRLPSISPSSTISSDSAILPHGAISPDSADAIRASLRQPPGEPPLRALDLLSVPLQVVTLPVALSALLVERVLRLYSREGPPNRVFTALRDARAWGLATGARSFGPRSGLGGGVTLLRFSPFYAEMGISIRADGGWILGGVACRLLHG